MEMQKRSPIKALTIRKLPEEVADAVRRRAEETHASFTKALISLLEEHLGKRGKAKKKRDLQYMVGIWSDQEIKEFDECLAEQRKIDPEMWK